MDKLSILGLLTAFLAIYIGFSLEGGSIGALFQLPALIIVVGGTLGAVMLNRQLTSFSMLCHYSNGFLIRLNMI